MATKNLGQVAGVHISTTPPENKILLWYDDTPSQRVHKVWDKGLNQWVVLNKNNVSSITYSELVGLATNTGLSIQSWYKITDKGNLLALAITTTKVQYHDSIGNILIDDLGSNIQYHVTSSNLLVDDIAGVFDNVNKKLVFQFSEHNPDFTADDYILGKVKRGNIWSLAKYKLSSFLSKVTGNSITWNGGFFFNFNNALSNVLDKEGGVVSKQTHDNTVANLNQSINNVGTQNQNIINNANQAIAEAVEDAKIYDKKTPALQTGGEPIDVATGDKLITIISKFQRWINKFKFATGIKVSSNFNPSATIQSINNNDTVDSALRKVSKNLIELNSKVQTDVETFDYIIDSNESLRGLKGNVTAKSVLIKKGEWVYTPELEGGNVDSALRLNLNIKYIKAEEGAVIRFKGNPLLCSEKLMYYENKVDSLGSRFHNINIVLDFDKRQGFFKTEWIPFHNLSNLLNCSVETYSESEEKVHNLINGGFNECSNLVDCSINSGGGRGFYKCDSLINCYVTNSNIFPLSFDSGFFECKNLHNCTFEADGTGNPPISELTILRHIGFSRCKTITACQVKSKGVKELVGFWNCDKIVNSTSNLEYYNNSSASTTRAIGFSGCIGVIGCYSTVLRKSGSIGSLSGFTGCRKVIQCISDGFIQTGTESGDDMHYRSSFSNDTTNETFSCDNTANGGFND